ncbi:MAG: triose-phosphate isomerase [Proteobacteria bacterium]|nr:triose-phosphate isomerase [Pseudomonadota bacterium]MDA0976880.1 triose-phosphate isomerase [Pseudomonadota bacterium]MDA1036747.1 triose-phosphate isomerase [Pseudomonadota bacterium]
MIIANWKANGNEILINSWCNTFSSLVDNESYKFVGIAPSSLHFHQIKNFFEKTSIQIGFQDIDIDGGARTGSISASMASNDGCAFSLAGHSERREIFKDDNALIKEKIEKILDHRMTAVFCVGESFEDYQSENTKDVLKSQILESLPSSLKTNNLIIAYEPVWAIGSGRTPNAKEVNSIHEFIKDVVQSATANNIEPKVLYGGSVNQANASDFFNEKFIDGALIGGASLDANVFADILDIYKRLKEK